MKMKAKELEKLIERELAENRIRNENFWKQINALYDEHLRAQHPVKNWFKNLLKAFCEAIKNYRG